ncbi:putative chromosome-partitioning protein ParB [Luteitalea pratensis]|uniref:Putative chromosome-partitioning protein ParB n=1 Tax=Luteitalea pratensis TaxID=1855912 RepID=A0A143PWS8_LUTPR|nr:ParB/RepB/Spo0J family partition protein [Luteitalea pratensis]AMY13032.1 putative chromosome-partitioning protein ParB [Luteitalea pratensis]
MPVAPPVAVVEARQPQREVDLDLIDPNPLQPRTRFDDVKLQELAESISSAGLVQPIVVRRKGERFEIVAGERRWRAAQIAGLLKLPVHVSDVSDEKLLQTALIENIQREDLNPIEEAQAYKRMGDESGLTQEQIAVAVGKDRASIANYLRLLRLPEQVRARVASGELSMGHARALLAVEDTATLLKAVDRVVASGMSVRATEALARKLSAPPPIDVAKPDVAEKDVHTRQAEERLRVVLGTRVHIQRKGKGGRVEIEFVNEDELIRLYEYLVER